MATALLTSDAPSVYSLANSSKRTFTTTQHDVQGTEVTDIERTEFLRNGYCPFHPDIQLKKRRRWTRRWKTVLRECPRCAADFLMRQLALAQPPTSSIPMAVVERQSSCLSETSSLSHRRSEQHPALLPQRSASQTTSSTTDNPSLFSRQAANTPTALYSPAMVRRDDTEEEHRQVASERQEGPSGVVVPTAAAVVAATSASAFWKSKSMSFRSSETPGESSLITKSSSWNPFAAAAKQRGSNKARTDGAFPTEEEDFSIVQQPVQAPPQQPQAPAAQDREQPKAQSSWRSLLLPLATNSSASDVLDTPSKAEEDDTGNGVALVGAGGAEAVGAVGLGNAVSREDPDAPLFTDISTTSKVVMDPPSCGVVSDEEASSTAVEVISTKDPLVATTWIPFAHHTKDNKDIVLVESRGSEDAKSIQQQLEPKQQQPWTKLLFSRKATNGTSDGGSQRDDDASATHVVAAAAVATAAVAGTATAVRLRSPSRSTEECREEEAARSGKMHEPRAVELVSQSDASVADDKRSQQVAESNAGSTNAVEVISAQDDSSSALKSASWNPFAHRAKEADKTDVVLADETTVAEVSSAQQEPKKPWKKLLFPRKSNASVESGSQRDDDESTTGNSNLGRAGVVAATTATAAAATVGFRNEEAEKCGDDQTSTPIKLKYVPTSELIVSTEIVTEKENSEVASDRGSSSAVEVTSTAAASSSAGSSEGTSPPQLDPVFEPMLKKTYSQVEILEREAAEATKMDELPAVVPELNSVVDETATQEAEPNTSGAEVRKSVIGGGCRMFDCLLSMDSFGCVGGGCQKTETEQLLDAVPSADRDVKSCTGIDSVY